MGKYTGHITEVLEQTAYRINCIIDTPSSPKPIAFSGFPIPSEKPLAPSSPVYIEGNWSLHKKLGCVIKGIIRPIDSNVLPRVKKVTHFNQKQFLAELNEVGIKASAKNIQD